MNVSDLDKLVHGYVHGHIHKHSDHTHIHGHIHCHEGEGNDDSDYGQIGDQVINDEKREDDNNTSSAEYQTSNDSNVRNYLNGNFADVAASSKDTQGYCPLDSLPVCDEVLCSDLDDCFYSNCDDTRDVECYTQAHEIADCCQEVPDKMLNSELERAQSQYDNLMECSEICKDTSCIKHEDANIYCHGPPQNKDNHDKEHHDNLCNYQKNGKHFFEQIFDELNNDFNGWSSDQVPKFQTQRKNSHNIHYPHESHPLNSIHKSCFHTSIPDKSILTDEQKRDCDFQLKFFKNMTTSNDPDKLKLIDGSYNCKWDNCNKNLNNDTLLQHLIDQHIDSGSDLFNCEWDDCNYSNTDYDDIIHHLQGHKQGTPNDLNILTPSSSLISPKQEDISQNSSKNDINKIIEPSVDRYEVTNIQITPKPPKPQADEYFTCCWEVGIDANGIPIKCNKTHDSAGDLHDHIVNDHIGSGKSSYNCNWIGCERYHGKVFPQRQKLLRHIHIHTNFKPWKCKSCGAQFAVESMLTQHMRIHSGEKPFPCNICGKTFATSSSLSIHNRVHTGEKPLICKWPGCGKKFSESSNLTKHMKTHVKDFTCNICHASFDKKSLYLKHMKQHEYQIPPVENKAKVLS